LIDIVDVNIWYLIIYILSFLLLVYYV